VASFALGLAVLGVTYAEQTRAATAIASSWVEQRIAARVAPPPVAPPVPPPPPTRLAHAAESPAATSAAEAVPAVVAVTTLTSPQAPATTEPESSQLTSAAPAEAPRRRVEPYPRGKRVAASSAPRPRVRDSEPPEREIDTVARREPTAIGDGQGIGLLSPSALERARGELIAPYDGGP
jgi:hypothetical protein